MVRVAFLIEETSERISCMLNPESVVVRRQAGVKSVHAFEGAFNGQGLSDDPLLYTGGGKTEVYLELLFDLFVAGHTISTEDVRDLTRPLVELAENFGATDQCTRPPYVRFMWGTSWNIPGLIVEMAERFENFTPNGEPRRSWVNLKLLRCLDEDRPDARGIKEGSGIRIGYRHRF